MIDPALGLAAEECALRHGAHVVDLVLRGDPSKRVLEVYVDSEGGVTVELCSEISRDLSAAIQLQGVLRGSYRLEVSSPGIERPLLFPWQYRKHVGRRMRIRWDVVGTLKEETGVLRGADEAGITFETETTHEQFVLPFSEIRRATVVAPW
jgi:ribosome maturation factor RimP